MHESYERAAASEVLRFKFSDVCVSLNYCMKNDGDLFLLIGSDKVRKSWFQKVFAKADLLRVSITAGNKKEILNRLKL